MINKGLIRGKNLEGRGKKRGLKEERKKGDIKTREKKPPLNFGICQTSSDGLERQVRANSERSGGVPRVPLGV